MKLSANPSDRRDHCITEHKFPSDFRFDNSNQAKKKTVFTIYEKNGDAKAVKPKSSSVLQQSKLVSVTTHDEDIELEDKSILLTAQRKHFTNFTFGHKKSKSFQSNGSHNKSYAQQLTAKSEITKKPQSALENSSMVDELMESLPQ